MKINIPMELENKIFIPQRISVQSNRMEIEFDEILDPDIDVLLKINSQILSKLPETTYVKIVFNGNFVILIRNTNSGLRVFTVLDRTTGKPIFNCNDTLNNEIVRLISSTFFIKRFLLTFDEEPNILSKNNTDSVNVKRFMNYFKRVLTRNYTEQCHNLNLYIYVRITSNYGSYEPISISYLKKDNDETLFHEFFSFISPKYICEFITNVITKELNRRVLLSKSVLSGEIVGDTFYNSVGKFKGISYKDENTRVFTEKGMLSHNNTSYDIDIINLEKHKSIRFSNGSDEIIFDIFSNKLNRIETYYFKNWNKIEKFINLSERVFDIDIDYSKIREIYNEKMLMRVLNLFIV